MDSNTEQLQSLLEYTEKEKVYKKFYEVKDDPEAKRAYMEEIEDYVRSAHLLIFDFPFITHPPLLREEDLFSYLSIT